MSMRALQLSEREGFPAGTRLGENGRYKILERIGKGAMAEVFKAVDTRLNGRLVAVKTLSPSVETHTYKDRMRALFIEEAQALSRVKDDNVVAVLDSGITPGGTPYMVMEFLNGQDLGQLLKKEEKLAVERAVEIMVGVCAGVYASHLAGIIHRDLKPANIFLDLTLKGEQTKVVDFSVAKIPLAGQQVERDHTRTDLVVGTPTYMSPEQALGKPATALSDQYSIGAILYRCLTGRVPHGALPSLRKERSDIPEALESAIMRAMDARPEHRFPSVFELGGALYPFASASGRARWKAYYTVPRIPVGPASSGSVKPEVERSRGDLSPTAVKPYDFRAHDRTTGVNEPTPSEGTTTTVDLRGPSTVGVGTPTTVENSARAGAVAPLPGSLRQDPAVRTPSAGTSSWTNAIRARRAQSMIVAAGLAVALLIVGATAGMRAWRSRRPSPPPSPPTWTQKTASEAPSRQLPTPPVPAPAPSAAPVGTPPTPGTSPPGRGGVAGNEPDGSGSGGARAAEGAPAHQKHRSRTARPRVQYTKDGVPLLSPE